MLFSAGEVQGVLTAGLFVTVVVFVVTGLPAGLHAGVGGLLLGGLLFELILKLIVMAVRLFNLGGESFIDASFPSFSLLAPVNERTSNIFSA